MTSVGIDVSKDKSTVCILRPYGEVVALPYEILHAESEISTLVSRIQSIDGEVRIVMEATGVYRRRIDQNVNAGSRQGPERNEQDSGNDFNTNARACNYFARIRRCSGHERRWRCTGFEVNCRDWRRTSLSQWQRIDCFYRQNVPGLPPESNPFCCQPP